MGPASANPPAGPGQNLEARMPDPDGLAASSTSDPLKVFHHEPC